MKLSIIIASCLVGYVAATPTPQGSVQKDAEWTVSDLFAQGDLDSLDTARTRFGLVLQTSQGTATCNGTGRWSSGAASIKSRAAPGGHLGSLAKTACDPSAFAFSWTAKDDGGATLEIFDATTAQHAQHDIPASQIVTRSQQGIIYVWGPLTKYAGPTGFVVETALD